MCVPHCFLGGRIGCGCALSVSEIGNLVGVGSGILVNQALAGQFGGCWSIWSLRKRNHLIDQQPPNLPGPPAQHQRERERERETSERVWFTFVDSQPQCDGFGLKTDLATRMEPAFEQNSLSAAPVGDVGALVS